MTRTARQFALSFGAAAAALVLTAGVYVTAQDRNTNDGPPPFMGRRGGPPVGGMGPLMPGLLSPRLGLTDAQKEQIKGVVEARGEEWKAVSERMRTARQALDEAINSDAVNEALIRQLSADVAAVEADANVARARVRAEVFQFLTPEQQALAREMASRGPGRGRGKQ